MSSPLRKIETLTPASSPLTVVMAETLRIEDLEAAKAGLTPAERARIELKKRADQQLVSVSGLWLAKHLTGAEIKHDVNGRPQRGLSISHKEAWVVAARSANGDNVGVDIEDPLAMQDTELFSRHALSARERNELTWEQQFHHRSEREMIALHWSLKECLFKAKGIDVAPSELSFTLGADGLYRCLNGPVDVHLRAQFVGFHAQHVITALLTD